MSGSAGELAQQEDLGVAGTFRTALLHTSDGAKAARFYRAVFSWEVQDTASQSLFTLRGQPVAGLRRTTANGNLWVPYVAVDDVAASATAAAQAGGRIASTSDHSLIKDPEGAVIGLCALKNDHTATLTEGAGTIWWAEVLAQTPSILQEFYARLFQWHSTEQPLAPHPLYVVWKRGEKANLDREGQRCRRNRRVRTARYPAGRGADERSRSRRCGVRPRPTSFEVSGSKAAVY